MSTAPTFTYKDEQAWPDNPMQVEDWEQRWHERKIGFHKDHVHPLLQKYASLLVSGLQSAKLFFPLCGKDVGMKWMYDQGHRIVGIEASVVGIKEFFDESNMEFTVEDVPSIPGKLYKSSDDRIRIYCCDLYAFNRSVEGQFDGVWDRGSLVAVNKTDRQKYADLLVSLMADKCNYLLVTVKYDPQQYAGPPHYVPDEQVFELYEGKCKITLLEREEETTEEKWKKMGLSEFKQRIHVLTPLN